MWISRHPLFMLVALTVIGVLGFTAFKYVTAPGAAAGEQRGGPRSALVTLEAARIEEIRDEIEGIGTVLANESIVVTAKVTDTVNSVNFEDGDNVRAGEILVEVADEEEMALLEEARANFEDAERQHDRFQDLARQASASQQQLDESRARLEAARARLDAIEARLKDRVIRAPFAGVLGFRTISPGELVTPGTEITTLDDISTVKLDFTVPERFVSMLRPGLEVIAKSTAWQDREFRGQVTAVGNRVDPQTRAVPVRGRIPNEDLALRPGMLVTVRLVRARDAALVVNEAALVQVQDDSFVYTVADGRASRIPVEIGRRRPGIVEILAGLDVGDEVITLGVDRVRPGMPVHTGGREGARR